MFINRKEYCTQANYYSLELTPELIAACNDEFHKSCLDAAANEIEITEKLIADTFNNNYDDLSEYDEKYDTDYRFKSDYNGAYVYRSNVFDFINDYFNDMIWDSFVDSETLDAYDYETEIVEA